MGMEIKALGEGHSEDVVPERKKNRNRKQDPQQWLLLINTREVKALLTRRNDLHR